MKVEKHLSKAKKLLKQGNKEEAAKLFVEVLQAFPQNKQAKSGLQEAQAGFIQSVLPQLLNLFKAGNFIQAIEMADKMIKQHLLDVAVYNVKAASLYSIGRPRDAVQNFKKAIDLDPNNLFAYTNITGPMLETGQFEEAEKYASRGVKLAPEMAKMQYNLAVALRKKGDIVEAIDANRKALNLDPKDINIINNLGAMLNDTKQPEEAYEVFSKGLLIDNTVERLISNRAMSLVSLGRWKEAIGEYNKIKADTQLSGYYLGLADLHIELKQYEKALHILEKGIINCTFNPSFYKVYMLLQCYWYDEDNKKSSELARSYNDLISPKVDESIAIKDSINTDGKLRIGYVSPDFSNHSVARFFEPLIERHSKTIESYCYYNFPNEDELTLRIKEQADHWRCVARMSDSEAVEQIQKDGIDILVDLAGYTDNDRLSLFAKKPAPVQVTWLGFGDTTGLSAIDYRIVDKITDPSDVKENHYSETLYRLPSAFLAYKGDDSIEASKISPFENNGYITFGSFNNLDKVTKSVISTWAEILTKVKNSRLILKAKQFQFDEPKEFYLQWFKDYGIDSSRIKLIGRTESVADHLALYSNIDICLDTFPYNGTTTTCEALWMGPPVITFLGDKHVARVGATLLHHVDLDGLVAQDIPSYVDLAISLANDTEKLKSLRRGMRERIRTSELCNHQRFAKDMEQAYLNMWQKHLDQA